MKPEEEKAEREGYEYARFESLARKVVNTPKPKPSADDVGPAVESAEEPAEHRPEREEPDGDGD